MNGHYHRYRAHGLTIDSDIELPELALVDGAPDVLVRRGPVADSLGHDVVRGPGYEAAHDRFLLNVPGVARYDVTGGRTITVDASPAAADADVRVYLFASAMAALLHQRRMFAMHASGIEIDGGCVLFAGNSGAGKSTLTAAFHDRGYPVITDDVAVVSFDATGAPLVHPGYRQLRLAADSLHHVGVRLGSHHGIRAGRQKFSFQVPGEMPHAPVRPTRMYLLTRRGGETVALRPLAGHRKIIAVIRATYRRGILAAVGQRDAHFTRCAALAQAIEIAEVDRPEQLDQVTVLVDAIERDVRQAAAPACLP